MDEPFVIEFIGDKLAVVDREVVHHHYPLLKAMYPFELLYERQEGVYCITPKENLSKHKSMVKAQCTNHRNTLTPLVW